MGRELAVLGGVLVVVGLGVAAFFLRAPAGDGLGGGSAPAATAAPAAPAGTKAPLPPTASVTGSGATLADEQAHYPTPAELAEAAKRAPLFRDYVCGTEVLEADAVSGEHQGTRYLFCSEACRDRFQADPLKYLDH